MSPATAEIRPAEAEDIAALASIWYNGWQDAHAALLPDEVKRARTLESFGPRLDAARADVRVAGPVGAPIGFCMLREDELYQLYVAAEGRGTGVAQRLVEDAEHELRLRGYQHGWLACAMGNTRAERFYEKCGWSNTGMVTLQLSLPSGAFPLDVWRYEKALR